MSEQMLEQMALDVRRLFGIRPAAHTLGVSPDLLRRMVSDGTIRSVTVGGRRLIPISEIERIAEQGAGSPRRKPAAQVEASAPDASPAQTEATN